MQEMTITGQIQLCLDRFRQGDASARDEMIGLACGRLTCLTRKMLSGYPGLEKWVETGDVFQNATIRLCNSLETVVPETVRSFYGLASLQIRRELIDLCRHHRGRSGHEFMGLQPPVGGDVAPGSEGNTTYDAHELAVWTEFHEFIGSLPESELEIVNLLWYQELPQTEAAQLVGVDRKTVRERWRKVRQKIAAKFKGTLPET